MLEIELTKLEYDYLCQAKFLPNEIKNLLLSTRQINHLFILSIPPEQADLLRDLCGERLQTNGFDERYELTSEGEVLESLIDKLFVG